MAGSSWQDWDTAWLSLSRLELDPDAPSLSTAFEQAARLSVSMLKVDRVGVWLEDTPRNLLRCVYQFDLATNAPEIRVLQQVDLPSYRAAMDEHRFIVADDAKTHPFTRELRESYLDPLGIVSMLDAPIHRGQELLGVVCHEHRGEPRKWTRDELHFAGAVADIVALFLEQRLRYDLQAALHVQEVALQRADRLNGVARLAAGVAHDFNNLLTVILSLAKLGAGQARDPNVHATFEEITDTAERAARLSERLLRFGSGAPASNGTSDLTRVVLGIHRLLQSVSKSTVVSLELASDPLRVTMDTVQVEQILVNLVSNAIEAGATKVILRTRRVAQLAVLEVVDDGTGMPPEVLGQVFEPLFTTKENGTGLGLPTVFGLVKSAGGSVSVDSAPDGGTTVTVRLPTLGEP